MPKKFDPALKERAVRMVLEQAKDAGSVSKACELVGAREGVGKETVRGWVRAAKADAGTGPGPSSEEAAQVKTLKARVRSLEEENAILRSAATFFAGELDPRRR
ncbi:transposase [Arsenicicoccus piscis]|uniref:Insertion element IS6110 uncharacterized 12.0 kDa protein n=1 Tax=Arsenicicoccus piscis TaxID=673954 RepID=A0ABQ6HNQ0_9MICO|nr:transposase [Arsenicicoccus piscis]MCH8628471.1 transposase [Arsenicicoccus piscis]GMA19962.1 insertion element IS6110 uncharacterized 12.0 kDa protein [Arsenicicoccus piscis]